MKKMILGAMLVLAAAGCGKLQEDPLKGFGKNINNGRSPSERQEEAEALSRNLLRLDRNDQLTFKEGREDEFSFVARVLSARYETEIVFRNLADFPGAAFDAATGKLKWTPPAGFISSGLDRTMKLFVEVIATPQFEEELPLKITAEVPVTVVRDAKVPEIISKGNLPTFLREGDSATIEVVVRDTDSSSATPPALNLLPTQRGLNLSTFTRVTGPTRSSSTPDLFTFRVTFDLSNAEITRSGVDGAVRMQAVSQFQKLSKTEDAVFRVYTKLSEPLTTWFTPTEFQPAVPKGHSFQIFDPRQEGRLTIRSQRLPSGATLTCQDNSRAGFVLNCLFNWVAPATAVVGATETVSLQIESRNLDGTDSTVVTASLSLPIRIAAPPSVPEPGTPSPQQPAQVVSAVGGL